MGRASRRKRVQRQQGRTTPKAVRSVPNCTCRVCTANPAVDYLVPMPPPPRRITGGWHPVPTEVTVKRDLERLAYFDERVWSTELEMLFLVQGLRRNEVSWARIGEALAVTRQAAQQRFGPKSMLARRQASFLASQRDASRDTSRDPSRSVAP